MTKISSFTPSRGLRYTPWWYKGEARLCGRTAIVTGAGEAVGQAIGIAFAREGADVLLSFDAHTAKEALETSAWIERAGRRAALVPLGARTQETCTAITCLAMKSFGRIDIVADAEGVPPSHRAARDAMPASGVSGELLVDTCLEQVAAGGAITHTLLERGSFFRRGDIYEVEAAVSASAQRCALRGIRLNGVRIGTPEMYSRLYDGPSAGFSGYLADIATAHVLLASHEAGDLMGTILAVKAECPSVAEVGARPH